MEEVGGKQYVLSAVMHADERNKALSEQLGRDVYHYHLHVVYVPVVQKEVYFRKNNKNPELAGKLKEVITQVSHSKKWPKLKQHDKNGEVKRNAKGKPILVNAYSLLQDHFYDHMREAGFKDFERGERGSTAEHLTVLEYKTQQETERAAALSVEVEQKQEVVSVLDQQTEKKKQQLDRFKKETIFAKEALVTFAEIERMGEKRSLRGGVSLSPVEWKTVSGLAKEGVKSRSIIAGLKKQIADFVRKITGFEQRLEQYEGKGIFDNMRYYQARQRAPRRMAEIITDIMRSPPETKEHVLAAPQRKRHHDLDI